MCLYVSMQRRKYEITTNIYHFSAARWANAVVEGVTIHTRALLRKQEGKINLLKGTHSPCQECYRATAPTTYSKLPSMYQEHS